MQAQMITESFTLRNTAAGRLKAAARANAFRRPVFEFCRDLHYNFRCADTAATDIKRCPCLTRLYAMPSESERFFRRPDFPNPFADGCLFMTHFLLTFLFKCLAALPLRLLHALGSLWGGIAFRALPKERARVRAHLTQAGLPADDDTVREVFRQTAKGGLELPVAFFRRPEEIEALFHRVYGWEHVQTALDAQQGLLLITPHIGSYDLAGRYISQQLPFALTAMYKPPKIKALDAVMQAGRVRGKGQTAPASIQGVKQVIKALRAGEATIVLPDHVPAPSEGGDGVWADFFGRPAYTMTLAGKLAQVKNVKALFFVGERLPNGQGFALHIEPLHGELNGDKTHDARIVNQNVEHWIRRFPTQYLFMYNRYKHPAGAPLPPQNGQTGFN